MDQVFSILSASLPSGLLMAGVTLGLGASFRLMRFPDLTVEGSFLIGAATWATLCQHDWHTLPASIVGIAAGALCGGFTAVFSRVLGIDRFLSGILVTAACYSIALIILGRSNLGLFNFPSAFVPWLDQSSNPILAAAAVAFVLLAITGLFFSLRVGIRARVAAINPQLLNGVAGMSLPYLIAGLAITNAAAAAAGIGFSRFQGFVDVGMGQGVLIVALAGFAIGEALMRRIAANLVISTLMAAGVGSIFYQIVLGAALSFGVPAALTKLVSALIVLTFLIIQSRRGAIAEQPL